MNLALSRMGPRVETLSPTQLSACGWSGADGITHISNAFACTYPIAWFFPTLSFHTTSLLQGLTVSDLGNDNGHGVTYRHIRRQPTSPGKTLLANEGSTDLYLDTGTLLPALLTYSVRPDSGAEVLISVAIRYSDYRLVNGVQVPFHIERFFNGSLQLSIDIDSAQIK